MDEGFPLECAQDANTLRRMKKQHLVELAQSYGEPVWTCKQADQAVDTVEQGSTLEDLKKHWF